MIMIKRHVKYNMYFISMTLIWVDIEGEGVKERQPDPLVWSWWQAAMENGGRPGMASGAHRGDDLRTPGRAEGRKNVSGRK